MGQYKRYAAEFLLVGTTMVVGVLGFGNIYLGAAADPQPHHHLHVVATYLWMGLLLTQLVLLARGSRAKHRRLGLAVLAAGPLLVASAAMLTVHSADRALVSGEEDFLIVQNVLGTWWLALILFLAFALKKRRKVHGALLSSTLILLLGPALFFVLISFAPPFRIEGPETFYRFQTAALTGQGIILAAVLFLFLQDRRNNWAYPFAAAAFLLGEAIKACLTRLDLIDLLTRIVAAPSESLAFVVTFAIVAASLAATSCLLGAGRYQADRGSDPRRFGWRGYRLGRDGVAVGSGGDGGLSGVAPARWHVRFSATDKKFSHSASRQKTALAYPSANVRFPPVADIGSRSSARAAAPSGRASPRRWRGSSKG